MPMNSEELDALVLQRLEHLVDMAAAHLDAGRKKEYELLLKSARELAVASDNDEIGVFFFRKGRDLWKPEN